MEDLKELIAILTVLYNEQTDTGMKSLISIWLSNLTDFPIYPATEQQLNNAKIKVMKHGSTDI
jgi:hypothetical protein